MLTTLYFFFFSGSGGSSATGTIGILAYNPDGASQTITSGTASGSSLVGILQEAP